MTPRKLIWFSVVLVFGLAFLAGYAAAQQWTPLGPEGGNVRSLAYDPFNPDRVFLGTSAGQLYMSKDGGRNWSRQTRLGKGTDYVLDNIVMDPRNKNVMYVAAWDIEDNNRGDIFRSTDGGKSFDVLPGMHDKSPRAMAISASDSRVLVVGALDGVYRSNDAGGSWERISPKDHADLRNFESVAIDPRDSGVIYAGTWHLPWKTTDGGKNWAQIHKGMIDDSDVFSIIIDPKSPEVVYASACSGIYKSVNGASTWSKIQGIPFSARRTRKLHQDPNNPHIVYGGTTEGLWRSTDFGKTWVRISPANNIVNDVFVDPRNSDRILIATDRSGVLVSGDSGKTFAQSNRGFAHRQVSTLLVDADSPRTLYAGVLNDKEYGGVFVSRDGGQSWSQKVNGLGTRDVFALRQTDRKQILAGTNQGIFRWNEAASNWTPLNNVINEKVVPVKAVAKPVKGKKSAPTSRVVVTKGTLIARVNDLELMQNKWFAATNQGLYISTDSGATWRGGPRFGLADFVAVHVTPQIVMAAARRGLLLSVDGGTNWYASRLPAVVTTVYGVTQDEKTNYLWMATREGAFRSRDAGESWEYINSGLPGSRISSIVFDRHSRKLLALAHNSTAMYESNDGGRNWKKQDAGWFVRALLPTSNGLLATTAFDGVITSASLPEEHMAAGGGGGGSQPR